MIRFVFMVSVALLAAADDNELITVPEDVLKFIIGCRQAPVGGEFAVPLHQANINDVTGTTSQHISLLTLDELRQSLKQSVPSDAVLGQIISQVEDAANTDQLSMGRSDCAVENHISISVPAQEVDDFNDRVQMLMQQNTFLLLEQINTLFSYKLRAQKSETEKIIKRKTNQIMNKLDKIMAHLGIPIEDEDDEDEDDVGTTTMYPDVDDDDETTTVFPQILPNLQPEAKPESEPVSEPEPEPESEPEPEPQTEAPTTLRPSSVEPATMFPTIVSIASSEEDDDDDDAAADDVPVTAGVAAEGGEETTDGSFIRTSQQKPGIVFNSGIGFIRPLARPTKGQPSSRPTYNPSRLPSVRERLRLAAERRRISRIPAGTL